MEQSQDKNKLSIARLCKLHTKLKAEKQTWENHWQEVADYFVPRKNDITTTRTPGQKNTWNLLDSTGVFSNELLAGFLHGILSNPDVPWFELTTGDPKTDEQPLVRRWLQDTAKKVLSLINSSNFQTEAHEMYIDLPSIGTSCMLVAPDSERGVRFSTKFITEFCIKENKFGIVDTLFREWKATAAELIEEFGEDNVPEAVRKCFADGKETKYVVVHAVYPRYMVDPTFSGQRKFLSCYYLPELKHELDSGEFRKFPYLVPRWSKGTNESYGRSCAMNALPDQKVLNKMNETMLIGAQKLVDPPLQLPDDGFIMPIETTPGGLNYYRAGTQDFIRPVFNDTRVDFGYQAMEDRRKRVRDCFFVDQLRLQQGGPMMTATEVLQRSEEAARLMGPIFGRMQGEFLVLFIDLVLEIAADKNLIDPAPLSLEGKNITARYSSIVAKAQRSNDGQSMMQFMSAITPFLQMDQTVIDMINAEQAIRSLSVALGSPEKILRTPEELQEIRQSRAEAQAQMQAQVQQQQEIDNSLTIAKAMKETQGLNGY